MLIDATVPLRTASIDSVGSKRTDPGSKGFEKSTDTQSRITHPSRCTATG
jgi:hypothetical protein